jgi:hypothetical protein
VVITEAEQRVRLCSLSGFVQLSLLFFAPVCPLPWRHVLRTAPRQSSRLARATVGIGSRSRHRNKVRWPCALRSTSTPAATSIGRQRAAVAAMRSDGRPVSGASQT